jgi:glyoxylase-like metal-dependent hydrolase (beta-lactamase superfamily II)
MQRKDVVVLACGAAAGILLAMSARGAKEEEKSFSGRPWAQIPVETQKLAEGVYMITGEGGNIGLSVGDEGAVFVDSQFKSLAPRIEAAAKKLGAKSERMLVNTHWHFDHTGGNAVLASHGVTVLAHDNVRARLMKGMEYKQWNLVIPPAEPAALPAVTYADGVTLHVNGDELRVVHVPPSHTDGDSIVLFKKANVLHMGDVFVQGFPLVDLASGGSYEGFVEATGRALKMADEKTKIIPGHGPVMSRGDLEKWHAMVVTIRDRVKEQIAAGKSLEDTIASKPTRGFEQHDPPEAFVHAKDVVETAYRSMKR